MPKRELLAFALVTAIVVSASAQDAQPGPFGLKMGLSDSEIAKMGAKAVPKRALLYMLPMPSGAEGWETLSAVVSPRVGLCKIIVAGDTIETSAYGDALKKRFQAVREGLAQKYGSPKSDYDFLRAGSIWDEPNDWTMGLKEGERILSAAWLFNPQRPDGLVGVIMQAKGLSSTKAYLSLTYEFSNFDTCSTELKAATSKIY